MSTFKIGSFNIVPTIGIMVVLLAGIGAAPYGVRRLITGEWPTIKDAYEEYAIWRKEVWDVGAPHSRTRDYTYDVAKVEAGWREAHAKAGNPVVAPQKLA